MVDFLEFNDVSKEDRGALTPGRFKITATAIAFKNSKTGKLDQISASAIQSISWQRIAATHGLRVMDKNGTLYRFGGFAEGDFDKVSRFFKDNFDLTVREKEFCLKGWNWGVANFQGSVLTFDVDKSSTAFEVPLLNVSHCTTAKNEVTLEFHQNDDAAVSLMEMRFHIPNSLEASSDDPVQSFMEAVLAKADIIQATGDAIVTFDELQCLTPRGRYDVKLFPSFIQLHGKTFDYKIPLASVLRLFRLPHKDGRQVFFVLSMDPPIKQGQTRYHFLILLFNKDDETRVELNITDDVKDKFEGKIETTLAGNTVEIISRVMRLLVQRKVTIPSEGFGGVHQTPVITCSYKASAGLLYPLDRGFIYVHKPPIHIRFEEIQSINFARSGGSTRSFDFEVETKSGLVHTFSSIEKEEYAKLYDFVASKKLRVKNTGVQSTKDNADDDLVDSDVDDEPDAYLARVKQEAKERDDDSDESDESFNPGAESDVAEEFDSNASESDADSDDSEARQKKKERKEKKEKKKDKKERKPKKAKKAAVDGKPKKPMSAYFLWLNENREDLKKEYPGIAITELTKRAGERWKTITDKTKWEDLAKEAKETYNVAMDEFRASGGGDATPSKPAKKTSSKEKPAKKKKESKASPSKNSSSFKSKEFISDDDSSSASDKDKDSDDDSKRKSKKQKTSKKSKSKETSEEEESEEVSDASGSD